MISESNAARIVLAPLLLVVIVMSIMASLYLVAIADPEGYLHDFPVAVVNDDRGGELPAADGTVTAQNVGDQIVDQLVPSAAAAGIVIERLNRAEAFSRLNAGEVFGVVVIDSSFTQRLVVLGRSAVLEWMPDPLPINVYVNRGSGAFASAVTSTFAETIDERVNAEVGGRLTAAVRSELDDLNVTFTGAARLATSKPITVIVSEPAELPSGAANGLSAFYVTLLIVLGGFTGAMIVSAMVDGLLGQLPTEYGPLYQLRERIPLSRRTTLALKWAIMFLVAMILSGVFMAVCGMAGITVTNGLELWGFSVLTMFAVGASAGAVLAAFGNVGLILNLLFFVTMGLPSSGGTLPLEASPRFFTWLAAVEPMHVVYVGVRSILYFDADWGAGLSRAVLQAILGLVIGLMVGWLATRMYDRRGWGRYPGGMTSDTAVRVEASDTRNDMQRQLTLTAEGV